MGDPNMTQETARKLGSNPNDVSAAARAARELDDVLSRIEGREKRFAPEAKVIKSTSDLIDTFYLFILAC